MTRASDLLLVLGCVVIGIICAALAIGLCWITGVHLNSKQHLIALCGFSLMGLIYGVKIVNSPPGSGYIKRKPCELDRVVHILRCGAPGAAA
jgi:hypothetical protein